MLFYYSNKKKGTRYWNQFCYLGLRDIEDERRGWKKTSYISGHRYEEETTDALAVCNLKARINKEKSKRIRTETKTDKEVEMVAEVAVRPRVL